MSKPRSPRKRLLLAIGALFVASSAAPIGCCCIIPIPAVAGAEAPVDGVQKLSPDERAVD